MLQAGRSLEEGAQYLGQSSTAIPCRTCARFMPEHLAGAPEVLEFGELRRRRQGRGLGSSEPGTASQNPGRILKRLVGGEGFEPPASSV